MRLPSFVYFIKPVGMDGPIKIGCSAVPERRLYRFATWSPIPLQIAAQAPGGPSVESWLHHKFRAARLHLEWFAPVPELVEMVRAAARDGKIPGAQPVEGEFATIFRYPATDGPGTHYDRSRGHV